MAWVVTAVVAAFEVGATMAVIATAVMEVGIAMTVVGTITKSKELTKIGGVLSMAGGVASLAIGAAGAIGGAAAAGEAGVAEGAMAGAYSDVAGEKFAQAAADSAAGAVSAGGLDVAASGVQTFGIGDPGAGFMDTLGGKVGDSAMSPISAGFDAKPPVSLGEAPALNAQAAAPQVSGVASAAPADTASMANVDMSGHDLVSQPLGGADAAIPKPGMFEDPKAWFKNLTPDAQSRVSTALLQAGGQAVGGIFAGWSEEQKLALAQQSQDLLKQQVDTKNTNASYVPTIAFKPAAPKGLIAGAQGGK